MQRRELVAQFFIRDTMDISTLYGFCETAKDRGATKVNLNISTDRDWPAKSLDAWKGISEQEYRENLIKQKREELRLLEENNNE
jgi:hypothetical protein